MVKSVNNDGRYASMEPPDSFVTSAFSRPKQKASALGQRLSFRISGLGSVFAGRQRLEPEGCDGRIKADRFSPVLAKATN